MRIELKKVASEIPCESDPTVHGHGSFFSHLQKRTQGLNTRATSMAISILNRLISHDEQGF